MLNKCIIGCFIGLLSIMSAAVNSGSVYLPDHNSKMIFATSGEIGESDAETISGITDSSSRDNYRFADGVDSTVARFKLKDYRLIVTAAVNGKNKMKFKLGTGMASSVISKKAAKKLKLDVAGELKVRGSAAHAETRLVDIDSLQIEDLTWYPGQFEVVEDKDVSDSLFGGFDGVLGYDFFELFPVRINFDYKRWVLFDWTKAVPLKPGIAVDIDLKHRRAIKKMTLDGRSLNVRIDMTVIPSLVVLDDWIGSKKYNDRFHLDPEKFAVLRVIADYKLTHVLKGSPSLEFDGIQTRLSPFLGRRPRDAQQFCPANAFMGIGFLENYNLFIDYPNNRIYFEERKKKK